jgi:uncharacterized protein YbgA (DUF1722 family)/uncharacterized protein YbbK (DUF523 family)
MTQKLKIGLSACLAGDNVRYNGQNCMDKLIMNELTQYFHYIKVCPEMAIGMGSPRETIRIVKEQDTLKLRASKSDEDFTQRMESFSILDMERVKNSQLSGFIFKKGSPSCGLFRIKVYSPDGMPLPDKTSGFYAKEISRNFPWMPLEEEGRLNDPRLFENFIQRVFAIGRWQAMLKKGLSKKGLYEFHQQHKYWIMAHSQSGLKKLGKLLASNNADLNRLADSYLSAFTETVRQAPTSLKHSNVLYHLLGYFKKNIDAFDKQEICKLIKQYRLGYIPLVVPITRLSSYVKKYKSHYLLTQSYLKYPEHLGVLNKI